MSNSISKQNTQKNKSHYDKRYADVSIDRILRIVTDVDAYLMKVTTVDTSWVCMYYNGFAEQIKGKKVLELGCGNCHNAAVMAALGAQVYANDISSKIGGIIHKLNEVVDFEHPITYVNGDFLKADFNVRDFDIVVGKAFVHHLTHEQELEFLKKIQSCLKQEE